MKLNQLLNWISLSVLLGACSGPTGEAKTSTGVSNAKIDAQATSGEKPTTATTSENSVLGFYVGSFNAVKTDDSQQPMYSNKINITFDSVKTDMLYGHSIVAGGIRPFKGKIYQSDSNYFIATVEEPGTDKYDGAFTFTLTLNDRRLSGTWAANNEGLPVSERKYTLDKKTFTYDPHQELEIGVSQVYTSNDYAEPGEAITEDAGKINASVTQLTKADVENMYKRDLQVMRNAIYARHGYSFKNREMRYYFDSEVEWYIPVSIDVTKELTQLEKDNIALIKRYEKHASSYYDSFGR